MINSHKIIKGYIYGFIYGFITNNTAIIEIQRSLISYINSIWVYNYCFHKSNIKSEVVNNGMVYEIIIAIS